MSTIKLLYIKKILLEIQRLIMLVKVIKNKKAKTNAKIAKSQELPAVNNSDENRIKDEH